MSKDKEEPPAWKPGQPSGHDWQLIQHDIATWKDPEAYTLVMYECAKCPAKLMPGGKVTGPCPKKRKKK